jgi:ATP-dependent DNA ligase
MVSRKLDGVRTIAIENNGQIDFFSRTGNKFFTLSNLSNQTKLILDAAKAKYGKEFILDGECCLVKEDGKDDFAGIMKQITKKNYSIPNPKYILFDLVERKDFDRTYGETKFIDRMKMLEEINPKQSGEFVDIVQHELSINQITFDK